ncbi:hypothetical protein MK079_04245, partial [Candidatus Gracilibacteria bacterium]|nr:hypothetical protein [Candidatus Gracilibacteria bacterium]
QKIGQTQNATYLKARNYFLNLFPRNNLERVMALDIRLDAGQDVASLLSDIQTTQNTDGGYPLLSGYASDTLTTLKVAEVFAKYNIPHTRSVMDMLVNQIADDGTMKYFSASVYDSRDLAYQTWRFLSSLSNASTYADAITRLESGLADQTDIFSVLMQESKDVSVLPVQGFDGLFQDGFFTLFALDILAQPDLVIESVTPVGDLQHTQSASFDIQIKNIGYAPASEMDLYVFTDKYLHGGVPTRLSGTIGIRQVSAQRVNFNKTDRFKGDIVFDFYLDTQHEFEETDNWHTQNFSFAPSDDSRPALPMYFIAYSHEISSGKGFNIRYAEIPDDPDIKYFHILYKKPEQTQWSHVYLNPVKYSNGAFLSGFETGDILEVRMGVESIHDDQIYSFTNPISFTITPETGERYSVVRGYVKESKNNIPGVKLDYYGGDHDSDAFGETEISLQEGRNAITIGEEYYEPFIYTHNVVFGEDQEEKRYITRYRDDSISPVMSAVGFRNPLSIKNTKTKQIDLAASDNIAVKEFDLYYYDPAFASWIYLSTVPADRGVASYNWTIPAELLGTGYKLRATARDFVGNISNLLKYGPFEITDGTGPDGTISVAQSEYQLGEILEYSFNVDNPDTFSHISRMVLHSGNHGEQMDNGGDTTDLTHTYTIPLRSNHISDETYISANVCATNGECTRVESGKFAIVDRPFELSEPWQVGGMIGLSPFGEPYNKSFYHVSYGALDTIEVIYKEFYKYTGRDYRLIYRKYQDGAWQPEVVLKQLSNATGGNPYTQLYGINVYQRENQIGITYYEHLNDENIHYTITNDQREIFALLIENGIKKYEKQVSDDDTDSYISDIYIDENKQVHVVWREGYSWQTQSGDRALKSNTLSDTGKLGNEILLHPSEGGGKGFQYFDDTSHIIYEAGGNVLMRRWQNNTWGLPLVIMPEQTTYNYRIFSTDTPGEYDMFYNKYSGMMRYEKAYYIAHSRLRINGDQIEVLRSSEVTENSSEENIQKWRIIQDSNKKYHIVYQKRYWQDNRVYKEMLYTRYNQGVEKNFFLISPQTNIFSGGEYLFMDTLGSEIKLIYSAQIGGETGLHILSADLQNASQFGWPEMGIDMVLNTQEFQINFDMLGYRFSFWINLFE